ncbi:MAG: co-chaperone DjlA [Spongiibacteraceae bacterium]
MIIGKIFGAIFGFLLTRNWLGIVFGIIIGHYFDKGLRGLKTQAADTRNIPLAQHPFFSTVFTLVGCLAKADGRISEEEIAGAERLMAELGLSGEARSEAIALFKRGAAPEFQIEPQISSFLQHAIFRPELRNVLIEYLVRFALADGVIHQVEADILQRVAQYLGFDRAQFLQFLDMLQAQQRFHQQGYGTNQATSRDALADAYRALGVSSDASDAEIKKAYRKLMSQHHPDKLIAQGVPPDMVKLATEKTQEIQAAYELIEKSRK